MYESNFPSSVSYMCERKNTFLLILLWPQKVRLHHRYQKLRWRQSQISFELTLEHCSGKELSVVIFVLCVKLKNIEKRLALVSS